MGTKDISKKNKKLVKTRKLNNADESSDDDLSPTRIQRPKPDHKSLNKSKESKVDCVDKISSEVISSSETIRKISLKRKTRSQSLTSESESESEEEKPPKKKSSKSAKENKVDSDNENCEKL